VSITPAFFKGTSSSRFVVLDATGAARGSTNTGVNYLNTSTLPLTPALFDGTSLTFFLAVDGAGNATITSDTAETWSAVAATGVGSPALLAGNQTSDYFLMDSTGDSAGSRYSTNNGASWSTPLTPPGP
jgi:hypothetical protein